MASTGADARLVTPGAIPYLSCEGCKTQTPVFPSTLAAGAAM